MGSYIYLEPQMIAIFEGQPRQNKAELPLKTRDDGSFGFHIYIYRFIYIHGGGWLNHHLVHQGWITSSLGWCKPRDRICTAPKVFGDPGFWGDFFGSLESLRKTAWLDLYHIMICIYIYIYYLMIYDMYTFTTGIQALSLFFLMVFIYSPEVLAVEGMAQKFVFHAVHMQLLGLAKKVVRKVDESPGCCMWE